LAAYASAYKCANDNVAVAALWIKQEETE
jgi:hypothetical protein